MFYAQQATFSGSEASKIDQQAEMPRPRYSRYDVMIAKLAAESTSAAEVARTFAQLAAGEGWQDIPSERTVRRRALEFQKRLPRLGTPAQNWRFSWPDSMLSVTLPWEASRAALDLLKYRDEHGLDLPTNREAKFFWHIRQASPTIDDAHASTRAALLAVVEFFMEVDRTAVVQLDWLMWALAYQPWLSPEGAAAYERATFRGLDPIEADPIPAEATYTFEDLVRNFPAFVVIRSRSPDEELDDDEAW
jgi:hypothetical protein